MSKAKIQVIDSDGTFRRRLRSAKIPSASWSPSPAADGSPPEVMACDGGPSNGSWLLFTRSASNAKPNECREQTPAQALAWFLDNALHPPEPLVIRARRYWADWQAVRNAPEAMAALTALAQPEANAGDTTSQPPSDEDLSTLRRLGLITGDATSPPCITELVRELGIARLSNWMDAQVMRVAEWLKQNVGLQVAPNTDPSGPTTFSITRRWLKSWDLWRTEAHPFSQPPDVRQVAEDLAAATKAMLPVIRRFGEPVEAAERLIIGLEGATPHRTPRMDQAAWSIQRQIIRIDHYISCGALSGDEDLCERRAEWDSLLAEFATEKARRDFKEAFDDDLARPRDDARYVHLLNAARDRRDRERIEIPLDEILAKPVVDHRSRCRRWKDLADHGLRFYLRRSAGDPGVDLIDFDEVVSANACYPSSACDAPQLRWAREMIAATQALRHMAADGGMSVDTQVAFASLERDLERVLAGEAVDIRSNMEKVRVLHTAIEGSLGKRQPTQSEEWQPTAHQQLVLKVLRRDGRLRAGVLWDRISPKHVDQRAHQSSMRDLIAHEQVKKAGKARATEYWIPLNRESRR